jgi:hypothetical protein
MIESEIRNPDGSYKMDAIALSNDFDKAVEEIIEKYKDKLSYDAILSIMYSSVYSTNTFRIAMEATSDDGSLE